MVHALITNLLDVSLVELCKGEYVSTIMIPIKNNIFGNWIKHNMCGDIV